MFKTCLNDICINFLRLKSKSESFDQVNKAVKYSWRELWSGREAMIMKKAFCVISSVGGNAFHNNYYFCGSEVM